MRKLTMVNSVEWTHEKFPVHVPLSCAVGGESRMHGAHGGLRHEVVSVIVVLDLVS